MERLMVGYYGPVKRRLRNQADGGGDWPLLDMLRLKEALEWCDLVDLGYVGSKLTSDNKREGEANIQVRLDRFVVEDSWQSLVLDCSPNNIAMGLKRCARDLRKWGGEKYGHISKHVAMLQSSLEKLYLEPRVEGFMSRIQDAEKELDKASSRKNKIMIIGLEDNDGHWRESDKDIKGVVLDSFSSLFCSAQPDERDIQRVNSVKLNQVLWPVDHDAVRSILLSNGSGGDKWVWHYNAKGVYKQMWWLSRLWQAMDKRLEALFLDLLRILSDVLSDVDLKLMCWISWKLWLERNKMVHGAAESDPYSILDFALAGFALAKPLDGIFSPLLAELLALRGGLKLVLKHGGAVSVVESDALNVVAFVNGELDLSVEAPIIEDIHSLLVSLQSPWVSHVRRSATKVAHLLAQFGLFSNLPYVWISETPSIVSSVVLLDYHY
ncbi:hypothetical protein TIFTF001_002071 [Ficus carica]|uniref:RNase H type-1 domain-containing protein n=1 Tax=Ficus carica TaxID=3494 RepID=A0AA87ZK80_FICCA|nr:hypothetical protein TIFTF001_002071 [Ficus carica]